jgi:group I intron endonuclease
VSAAHDSGVYAITNHVSGHRYIGSAVLLRKRWKEHTRQLSERRHHSVYLQRAWDKYGPDSFDFRPILFCAKEMLIEFEQRAMDVLKPEYNIAPVAGSQLGYRHSDETRAKLRAARARNGFSPMRGRRHTHEANEKNRLAHLGRKNGPPSADTREKIAASQRGRIVPHDIRARIAATLTGRKQCAETLAKRSASLRGKTIKRNLTDDQVLDIRARAQTGQTYIDIGASIGMSGQSIANIVKRKSYKRVA